VVGHGAAQTTTSPWDESAQHGGPPTALLATAMERAIGDPQMRMARITAEFLGVIRAARRM
jgi:hypothetical protein